MREVINIQLILFHSVIQGQEGARRPAEKGHNLCEEAQG